MVALSILRYQLFPWILTIIIYYIIYPTLNNISWQLYKGSLSIEKHRIKHIIKQAYRQIILIYLIINRIQKKLHIPHVDLNITETSSCILTAGDDLVMKKPTDKNKHDVITASNPWNQQYWDVILRNNSISQTH